jgi:hypothetical protein
MKLLPSILFLLYAFCLTAQPVPLDIPTNGGSAVMKAWLASNNVYMPLATNGGYSNAVFLSWQEMDTNPCEPYNFVVWRCTDLSRNGWEPIAFTTNTTLLITQHYAWAFYTVQAFNFHLVSSNSNVSLMNLNLTK